MYCSASANIPPRASPNLHPGSGKRSSRTIRCAPLHTDWTDKKRRLRLNAYVPVPLDHLGEFLIGRQALPLQARPPVIEEFTRPGFAVVVPELAEGFFQQVGGVQALVGRQQQLQVLAGGAGEVLRVRQERVFLALDEM